MELAFRLPPSRRQLTVAYSLPVDLVSLPITFPNTLSQQKGDGCLLL